MAIKTKTVVKKVSDYSESEVFFVDKKPMKECAICMEFIKDTDKTILKCGHEFHASCMFTNLVASNNTCPLCRDEISEKPEGRPDMTQGLMREFMQNEFNEIELSCYMEELFSLYGKKTENGLHWKDLSLEERAFISEPIISLMLSFGRRLGKQVHRWIEEGNERMVIPDEFQEDHFRIPLSAYQDDHDYDDMPPLMDPEEDMVIVDEHEMEPVNLRAIFDDEYMEPHIDQIENAFTEDEYRRYYQRIFWNDWLHENIMDAEIEQIMWPPGFTRSSRWVENGANPLFSREEAEAIMGVIIRYNAETLEE